MTTMEIMVACNIVLIVFAIAHWYTNRPASPKEKAEINKLMTEIDSTKNTREPVAATTRGLPCSYRDQAKPSVQEQLDELMERLDAQDKLLAALTKNERHQANIARPGEDEARDITDKALRELRVVAVGDPETPYLDESWQDVGGLGEQERVIRHPFGWKVGNGRG